MILGEGRNPGSRKDSLQDARKYRKAKNGGMTERWTETLEQDVEAEMREAEGEQRSGLEKAGPMEMLTCQTPRWAETWPQGESEAGTDFEKGKQAEGKGDQTHRQTNRQTDTWSQATEGDLVPRRLALPPCPSPVAGVSTSCPHPPGLGAEWGAALGGS